ncbi:LexA family transcriptional regulator [Pseudomonas sp. KBW05]|jgi:phage repressor protein C with HTH and peptisase S24 domain|uniref:LexA family transcriptional regulator n=1 Tax=Pseudomonas sp. KBW05 TaxID=2153360 RepID=UPI000F5A8DC0|nr:LexA family transcriptional regulator [Pseudomonas sp. KBW05]RQO57566.1 helix-turn-helix transcriptional regulator [Pseudomonas sp. KBW05]
MNRNERIARAIQVSGKSKSEIAKLCDVAPSAVTQWINGDSKALKAESVFALAKATGFTAEWLTFGTGPEKIDSEELGTPSEKDYALIPQYSAHGSSGDGYLNDHVEVTGGLAFKRDWLKRMSMREENLRVLYNEGDSNWPTLSDGEVLLVDVSRTDPTNGNMYAILNQDHELIIKRLIRDLAGGWIIRSDNQDKARYPDMPISDEGMRGVEVVGRVVWRGGGI